MGETAGTEWKDAKWNRIEFVFASASAMEITEFSVRGLPVPQGSTRAFVVKGRPVITSTSKGLSSWRHLIASEAQRHATRIYHGPVIVFLSFYLPKPKSAPKSLKYMTKRPDLDKLIRAVLDGITHVLLRDDSQVVAVFAQKEYGDPGVIVQVSEVSTKESEKP